MAHQKTAVLTGSTGGIGQEIAQTLATEGWNLILLNRSADKTREQILTLQTQFPNQTFRAYLADFMDLQSVKKAAIHIAAENPEIQALYNIAGAMTNQRQLGPQNIESQFAVNTVAPYLLIQGLRQSLSAGATQNTKSVIVNFSTSMIGSVKKFDVSNLQAPAKIEGMGKTYAATKLAVNVFNQSLKESLYTDGILIFAVDPGPTRTPMTDKMEGVPWLFKVLMPLLTIDVRKQTAKLTHGIRVAAAADETGLFISEGKVKKEHATALNASVQAELTELLNKLDRAAA